jgi:hypothetical protein
MNTDIYNISNSKIICRVLPFFARGRKMILFLESIATPLIKLHKAFVTWTFEMVLKVKITSQTTVLRWYLDYKFGHLFQDQNDSFEILQDNELDYLIAFNMSEKEAISILAKRVVNVSEQSSLELLSNPIKDASTNVYPTQITINAPAIIDAIDYTKREYYADIKQIIDRYKTTFVRYNIVINE